MKHLLTMIGVAAFLITSAAFAEGTKECVTCCKEKCVKCCQAECGDCCKPAENNK